MLRERGLLKEELEEKFCKRACFLSHTTVPKKENLELPFEKMKVLISSPNLS